MSTNIKFLAGKLNDVCRDSLEFAAIMAKKSGNFEIQPEHWFLKLLDYDNSDLHKILQHFQIDAGSFAKDLLKEVENLKTNYQKIPGLSEEMESLLHEAWLLASLHFQEAKVRSGFLVLALLSNERLARSFAQTSPQYIEKLGTAEAMRANLQTILAGSSEDFETIKLQKSATGGETQSNIAGVPGKGKALDQYTEDLTAKAAAGKIDPILGRDAEIRQLIDILMRRRQNNPILTGEAGVGKTAVVEGFALRIAQKDVPEPLKNVIVRTLDLGLLQAGAGVKGEFENRLKSVIDEVKSSPTPIIMFIDEAHTMIGAGGAAGQNDAANLLKPALARGELRTIAATTWAEYKKYFEKDAALARRFQVVKVEEPDEEKAIAMMRGLADKMESHHNVRILDEAIVECVKLSSRYITGRQLPDKSVSVLDTACAKVAIGQGATPAPVEDATRHIQNLTTEIDSLEREQVTGASHDTRLEELKAKRAETQAELDRLNEQWTKEKELTGQIKNIRTKLELSRLDDKLAAINSGGGEPSTNGGSPENSENSENSENTAEPALAAASAPADSTGAAEMEPAAGAAASEAPATEAGRHGISQIRAQAF